MDSECEVGTQPEESELGEGPEGEKDPRGRILERGENVLAILTSVEFGRRGAKSSSENKRKRPRLSLKFLKWTG
jgi:hypothetical protein